MVYIFNSKISFLNYPSLWLCLDSIITMLSHAMVDELFRDPQEIAEVKINEDDIDEDPPQQLPVTRGRSRTASKIDFCCVHENVIRCVCANIIAHIQTSENSGYVPPPEYGVFNKEEGSLVCSPIHSHPSHYPTGL
jgi:hypothetical protein